MAGKAQQSRALDDEVVMNLVELALSQPQAEREAYLREACGADEDLFNRVWNYVRWEDCMDGFLLDPLYPPARHEHPFQPGELLDGRFRILREVAQGGMGVVYEAVDTKLDRRIAIKCAKSGFRKRLPPEVRNAREVSHPNVCKIFEIHTASTDQGEFDFITMEYLEGETLAERLQAGPIADAEVRAIAHQLASGLAAAHRSGVIHGDLKSTNIILAKDSSSARDPNTAPAGRLRAVITDFGLARDPSATLRAAQSGVVGGTPNYMAPELWKGGKATTESDVYAFGVMLFELVSGGKHPYGSFRPERPAGERLSTETWIDENAARTAWVERLNRKPPPVSPKWDHILERALAPEPENRHRDGGEILKALEPSKTKRRALIAVAVAALATLPAMFTYQSVTAPKEIVRLAILPFTYSADLAPAAEGVFRETSANLAKLRGGAKARYSAVPLDDSLRRHVDSSEKAKASFGATHVLHGTLTTEKDRAVLQAFLTDTRTGTNVKDWKVEYAPGQVRYVPVALAGMVTGALQLPAASSATVNAAALNDYRLGLAANHKDSQADRALGFMGRAVEADPDSPLTYAGLAEAQWLKFSLGSDRSWYARAAESARQAELRNPDSPEVLRICATLRTYEGLYELAEAELRRAIDLHPGNSDAYRRLGFVFQRNRQLDEALAAYRKAVQVGPAYAKNFEYLGFFQYQQANYEEAARQYRKALELAPDESQRYFELGNALINLGEFGEAESRFREALRLSEGAETLESLGVALVYQKRYAEALPSLTRAASLAPEDHQVWMNMAICYHLLGRAPESEQASRRGRDLADGEVARNPRDGRIRANLAFLSARLGDRRRAISEAAQALRFSGDNADTRFMTAYAYEVLGQRADALSVLSASPRQVIADVSRWPDMAALQADPQFSQLLVSQHPK